MMAASPPTAPSITAIVLAAGQSCRMGDRNKLLAMVDGRPMIAHCTEAALASRAAPVLVVTGHQADQVTAALAGHPIQVVHNPSYAVGLSTSVKAGLAAAPACTDGVVILLGDMPWVSAGIIDRLIRAFDPENGRDIVVPVRRGERGNPVLWGHRHFDALHGLAGDVGARHLLADKIDRTALVEMDNTGILTDIDTLAALAALARLAPAD